MQPPKHADTIIYPNLYSSSAVCGRLPDVAVMVNQVQRKVFYLDQQERIV